MYFKEAKKSLKSELNNFLEKILNGNNRISKVRSLEARNKINPKVFIALNDAINEVIYKTHNPNKLWKGYRVLAIDGSLIEIPNAEALGDEYGQIESQNSIVVEAKVSCIFNVINKIILSSKIDKCKVSDQHMATEMISEIIKKSNENDLILFERGYYSMELLSYLIENNINFFMKLSEMDIKGIMIADKPDQTIQIKYNQKFCKVRVIRFVNSSSEEEILITSLLDRNLAIQNFMELFFMRWGEEIEYDELKNRLLIENFTGTNKTTIEQDFYAMIYLSNMVEMTLRPCDGLKDGLNKNKDFKQKQKSSLNILIGVLKEKLIKILLENNERKRSTMFREIMEQIKIELEVLRG